MSNVFVSGLWTVCCLDAVHVLLCCYCEPHSAGHFSCFMTSLQLRQSQASPCFLMISCVIFAGCCDEMRTWTWFWILSCTHTHSCLWGKKIPFPRLIGISTLQSCDRRRTAQPDRRRDVGPRRSAHPWNRSVLWLLSITTFHNDTTSIFSVDLNLKKKRKFERLCFRIIRW